MTRLAPIGRQEARIGSSQRRERCPASATLRISPSPRRSQGEPANSRLTTLPVKGSAAILDERPALPCRGRDRRRLPGQLVVKALPEALGPAFDDLSIADSVDVQLMERHALPSRCYAEVLLRVRALGRGAVRDEVAFRQDHVDPRADIREPAADDLETCLSASRSAPAFDGASCWTQLGAK